MTATSPTSPTSPTSADEQAITLAKQLGVVVVGLAATWVLARALAPDPTIDGEGARSLLTMPFVAALAAAVGLLSFNSLGFKNPPLNTLGSSALMAAITAGSLWFAAGILTTDSFSLRTVLHFFLGALLVATLIGSLVMLAQLFVLKVRPVPQDQRLDSPID